MTKRWVAHKVSIKNLLSGKPAEDNALEVTGIKINRARVLGSVVSKFIGPEDKYAFLVIDDGTETVRVRGFEDSVPLIKEINIGDVVDVIGRIRTYEDEIYIIPEIIKKITDPNWELLRKIELLKYEKHIVKPVEQDTKVMAPSVPAPKSEPKMVVEEEFIEEVIEISKPASSGQTKFLPMQNTARTSGAQTEVKESPRKQIIKAMTAIDKGEGVEITYLMEKIGLDKETVINVLTDLMNEGTIFEPRAGKVKILE